MDQSTATPLDVAPAAGASGTVRSFTSVTEATLALGCKTYTGTVAQGGSTAAVTPGQ